jgi:hypothetical protein
MTTSIRFVAEIPAGILETASIHCNHQHPL